MIAPFLDYTTVTVGSSTNTNTVLTTSYKALVCLEIVNMERNTKLFSMWAEVSPSDSRDNYFIRNQNIVLSSTNPASFGLTKVLPANTVIKRTGDFSPFTGIFHIFRLPDTP